MEWEHELSPLLAPLGLELYDVEFSGGTLSVVVTGPSGVDVEALTRANRAVSAWLDANDPIAGRYTLDVSSPGLERRLRTLTHFRGALGDVVTLRERREGEPTRRLEGTLTEVGEQSVTLHDHELGDVVVSFEAIERARTVFEWGATKPAPTKRAKSSTGKKG